jgi:hypothetical protein
VNSYEAPSVEDPFAGISDWLIFWKSSARQTLNPALLTSDSVFHFTVTFPSDGIAFIVKI